MANYDGFVAIQPYRSTPRAAAVRHGTLVRHCNGIRQSTPATRRHALFWMLLTERNIISTLLFDMVGGRPREVLVNKGGWASYPPLGGYHTEPRAAGHRGRGARTPLCGVYIIMCGIGGAILLPGVAE